MAGEFNYNQRVARMAQLQRCIEVLTGFIRYGDATQYDVSERYSQGKGNRSRRGLEELRSRGMVKAVGKKNQIVRTKKMRDVVVYGVVTKNRAIDDRTTLANEYFKILEYHEESAERHKQKRTG